ncbi:MAG: mycofactocin biosynthesis glycosyltransferase MftF [Nocardioides sp.]|jgi:mycofactocin system glycosyltransferase
MTLPPGFRVRLADGVIRADGGRLLVGGSPLIAMRLTERAAALLGPEGVTVTEPAGAHLAERLVASNLGLPDLSGVEGVAPDELTVVIPVRDRSAQLDRALAALRPLRCVVVDDASQDPHRVADVARRHGAPVVALSVNVGPAGARNAGLATVATPYVAFVDSDVEVTAADLVRLTRHFADPAVGLVGPQVTGVARSARPRWFERYDAAASSLTLGDRPGVVRPGAAVAWLPSACLVGRTDVLGGGFDATLRVGEDVDPVWRLVDSGARVRYDPSVRAHHDARHTLGGWLSRKAFYGSGGASLATRHGDRLAPAVLTPTYAVAGAALLLRRRWSAPVAAVALAHGWRSVRASLPAGDGTDAVAAQLAARGLGWAVRQESALLLRHWWPLAALGATRSRHVRRALVTALAVDAAVMVVEHRRSGSPPDPATAFAGRRLDDLAYGAGLWWGALRARSARVLLPRRPCKRRSEDSA